MFYEKSEFNRYKKDSDNSFILLPISLIIKVIGRGIGVFYVVPPCISNAYSEGKFGVEVAGIKPACFLRATLR